MRTFCKKIGFPGEAIDYLEPLYNQITNNKEFAKKLNKAKAIFLNHLDSNDFNTPLQELSEELCISRYTIDMIFLLYSRDCVKKGTMIKE